MGIRRADGCRCRVTACSQLKMVVHVAMAEKKPVSLVVMDFLGVKLSLDMGGGLLLSLGMGGSLPKLRAARCKASGVEVPAEMLPTRRARQGMPRRARSTRGPQFPGLSRAEPAPAAVPLTSARSRRGCAPSSAPRRRAPNFAPFSKQPSSAAQEGMARQEAERGGKVAGGARRGAGGGGARG